MAKVRTNVYSFEEGSVGAPFTPIGTLYGGIDDVFTNTGMAPVYSDDAATGSRSLLLPASATGSYGYYEWWAQENPETRGTVCGLEVSFKTDPTTWGVDLYLFLEVGDNYLDLAFDANGLWYAWARGDPSGPPGGVSIPLDMTSWFTAKLLPTGAWSLGYMGGATILSGQATDPPQPHLVENGSAYYGSYLWINPNVSGDGVSPLWIDDIVFWVDTPVGEDRDLGRVRRRFTSPDAVFVARS